MNHPLISIIIPVYNAEKYLRQCLDSVVAQTYTNWECLLVNDGSTDSSGMICDIYAANDSRFKIIHKENEGVSSARNIALRVAKGIYIGFCDSDDLLIGDIFDVLAKAIEETHADWIRIGYTNFYEDEQPPRIVQGSKKYWIHKHDEVLTVGCNMISRVSMPWMNYFRNDSIKNVIFPYGVRFREDAIFLFEMASKCEQLVVIDYKGYLRLIRNGSATFSPRKRDDSIKLYTALINLLQRSNCKYPDLSLWLHKDIRQWYQKCPDKTKEDTKEVRTLLRRIKKLGVVKPKLKFSSIELLLYIYTGMICFLSDKPQRILIIIKKLL